MLLRTLVCSCLLPGLPWLAQSAAAQTAPPRFSLGPLLGGNLSGADYRLDQNYQTSSRTGFEAGIQGSLHLTRVFSLQASLRYSQKGYHLDTRPTNTPIYSPDLLTTRLNYLTLPLNLVVSQHETGQGFQVIAGFYLGLLVGGHFTHTYTYSGTEVTLDEPIDLDHDPDYFHYSAASIDAGVQAGVGYRLGGALLQAGYSYGLADLSTHIRYPNGAAPLGPTFFNRAWQVSLAYLLPVGKQ